MAAQRERKISEGLGTFIRRVIRAELAVRHDTGGDLDAERAELDRLTKAIDDQFQVDMIVAYKPARGLKVTQVDLIGLTAAGGCECRIKPANPDSSRSKAKGRSRSRSR